MLLATKKMRALISLLMIASFVLTPFFVIKADLVDEIEDQIKDKSDQIKNLENQAEEYKDVIKDLQMKQRNLENEIELLDAQIAQLDIEIQTTQSEIDQTDLEIKNLMLRIQIKEEEIAKEKDILRNLLRQINDYDSESAFEILLKTNEISDFITQSNYVDKVGEKIKNALDALKLMKAELEQEKANLESKKQQLEELKQKITKQKEVADLQKTSKETLLADTRGREDRYQDLLFNVKNQKTMILGDINALQKKMEKEIARIAALAEKPAGNLASTSWYFTQNDPAWKDITIGFSDSTIDDYGCAIASVAMVFKYYGIDIDPGRLAKQPIFYYDLIVWPKQWRFLDLVKNSSHKPGGLTSEDWAVIDREIASGHPVMIFIRARGNAGHYVVVTGKDKKGYIVHDPMSWNNQSGANLYLSTTRKYLESIYNSTSVIDQYIIYH